MTPLEFDGNLLRRNTYPNSYSNASTYVRHLLQLPPPTPHTYSNSNWDTHTNSASYADTHSKWHTHSDTSSNRAASAESRAQRDASRHAAASTVGG